MASTCLVLLLHIAIFNFVAADIRLPSYYMDNMVFQADQDDTMIFGFTTNPEEPVLVTVTCDEDQAYLQANPSEFKASKANF